MSLLSTTDLGLEFGARDLFQHLDLEIQPGGKIGLVGANGIGKTSLLRILAGISPPTTGQVHRRRGTTIGYLRQEAVEAFTGRHHSIWDEMLTVFAPLRGQAEELRRLEERMAAGETSEDLLAEYGHRQEAFDHAGGYDYEQRIRRVLTGLGFPEPLWSTTVDHLSGGQKTRALLARLLLEEPTLLILDEPTNHLDAEAVEWLEGALRTWEGAVLVASHDRYFLDRVADRIWEMSAAGIEIYRGNYSAYLEQRQERWETNERTFNEEMERLREELETVRRYFAWRKFEEAHGRLKRLGRELLAIERFGILGARGKSWGETGLRSRTEMHLEEAHARIKAIRNPLPRPPLVHLHLPNAGRSGDIVLRTHRLTAGYDRPLVAAGDLEVRRGERIALIGPNGAGKTTLLRTILGDLPPVGGQVLPGASLAVGYFAQAHDGLDPEATVMQSLLGRRNLPLPAARNHLARYLFRGDDIDKTVGMLSGGERARLALAILALDGVNFLLLDEPTNHLDIPAQEVLQEVLDVFDGTILLVSHDRFLVDALATRVWAIEGGRLRDVRGSYAEYRAQQAVPAATAPPVLAPTPVRPRSLEKETRRRQERLAVLEERIAASEAELATCSAAMSAGDVVSDHHRLAELSDTYRVLEDRLAALIGEWEALAVDSA